MIDEEKMYNEKKEFVRDLNMLLQKAGCIPCIEYWHIREMNSEFLSINDYSGRRYIDVTADSLYAISQEISRVILRLNSKAEIRREAHKALIERWIELEKSK